MKNEWQKIETAPQFNGTRVLLFSERREILPGTRLDDEDWEADGGGLITPTHWMPLPDPPSEESK